MATSYSLSSILEILIILCIFFCPSSSTSKKHACTDILTLASLKNEPQDKQTLRVLVPWKVGFEQFVKFQHDSCWLDGFSIQVFRQALQRIQHPGPPRFKFVLFGSGNITPSYNEMIDMLANKTVDAVVADLTITKERMETVGFTVPYLASSLVMVTPFRYSAGTFWDFLKPFSRNLWIALLGSFVATGIALYLLEDQNPDFGKTSKNEGESGSGGGGGGGSGGSSSHGGSSTQAGQPLVVANASPPDPSPSQVHTSPPPPHCHASPPSSPPHDTPNNRPSGDARDASSFQHPCPPPIYDQASHKQRIMNAYWFTSLCVFLAQQESVRTHLGRFVTVTWLFVMLIFSSSYTASLASLLSAQKREPTIKSFQTLLKNENIIVGCQEGSFIQSYMTKLGMETHRLKTLASETDYGQELHEGTLNRDGVGALLDELPYIQILLQSECTFTKISTSTDEKSALPSFGGFGFAFQKGDGLIDQVSEMILDMAEDGTLQMLQNGYKIGDDKSSRCDANAEPSHLRLSSFGGLFSIVGSVYVICIIWRFSTEAIKSLEGRCNPLIRALPCTPRSSSIGRSREFSLGRRSNRVSDETRNIDHVSL